jgi:hypothetical protein
LYRPWNSKGLRPRQCHSTLHQWDDDHTQLLSQINVSPDKSPGMDISGWGVICIPDVRKFCQRQGLVHTLAVMDYNLGQL